MKKTIGIGIALIVLLAGVNIISLFTDTRLGYVPKKTGTSTVDDLTVLSDLYVEDGGIDITDEVATPTLASVMLDMYMNCNSGQDTPGCDDASYIVGPRYRFMPEDNQATDREATTTCEWRAYLDDSATSSIESSLELWCLADDSYGSSLVKVFEIDSNVVNLPASTTALNLSVTGSSTFQDILVNDDLTVTSVATIGTLSVTGSSTVKDISASDGVFTDGVTVATTLGVTGAATLGSTVGITGDTTILGTLTLGTSTASAYDLDVANDGEATTTIKFGKDDSTTCIRFIIKGTTYYLDPTAAQADDIATITQPEYCN